MHEVLNGTSNFDLIMAHPKVESNCICISYIQYIYFIVNGFDCIHIWIIILGIIHILIHLALFYLYWTIKFIKILIHNTLTTSYESIYVRIHHTLKKITESIYTEFILIWIHLLWILLSFHDSILQWHVLNLSSTYLKQWVHLNLNSCHLDLSSFYSLKLEFYF